MLNLVSESDKSLSSIFGQSVARVQKQQDKKHSKHKVKYLDYITAFDIETSYLPDIEQSIMYIWQFQIEDETFVGRTWQELRDFILKLNKWRGNGTALFVCYVHNLSYEWQFIKTALQGSWEVMATDRRKILKATYNKLIEFRCSYIQTNRSLDKFLKDMGVDNKKLHGFDYCKIRYPWTELTDFEMQYAVNDVVGLVQAIKKEMDLFEDNLYTIPLTSTGYVRRDAKKAIRQVSRKKMMELQPSFNQFQIMRWAFRGGNTHANRFYAGEILKDVYSCDRSSSYPDIMVNYDFPIKPFTSTVSTMFDYLLELNKPLLFVAEFEMIKLRRITWGCPYIPIAKLLGFKKFVNDNGRVISAEYIKIALTDIDFKIIAEEYEWESIKILNLYYSSYGKLPDVYRDLVKSYFTLKTTLKGVDGKELDYMLSKNKLNSLYGMMVQNPAKPELVLLPDMMIDKNMNVDDKERLEKYEKKGFLPYQWGVWVTAWARWTLEEAIKEAGDDFVYTDTDSVKSMRKLDLKEFNSYAKKLSMENGAYAIDPKGYTHHMGVYEQEGLYKEFVTLGAKKYCYVDESGGLHITLSGVSKDGVKELEKYDGIRSFKNDFVFTESAGLCSKYNDFPPMKEIIINGKSCEVTSNVALIPTTYQIGQTEDYKKILEDSRKIIEILRERGMYYGKNYEQEK